LSWDIRFAREGLTFWDKELSDVCIQLRMLLDADIAELKRQSKQVGEMMKETTDNKQKAKLANIIAEINEQIKSLA